ncbi:hypothetical protein VVR84_06300 [Kocuria carniphila]|uniref:MFS transporter n=1 Tax=Kocuria carniphila TaxID=262208 RepID=A0ABV3UZ85_9MICC
MSSSVPAPSPITSKSAPELIRDVQVLNGLGGRGLTWITLALRLPQVLAPLGVITWVATQTASPWAAALSSAAVCLGSALCGVLMTFFVNVPWRQWGMVVLALLQGMVMWLLPLAPIESVPTGIDSLGMFLPFFFAGLSLAPQGLVCRIRWNSLLEHRQRADLLPTAMRAESVSEAMSVVTGAAITGLIATTAGPQTVLRVSAVLSVVMITIFMLHPSARLKQPVLTVSLRDSSERLQQARRWSAQRLRSMLVVGCGGLGALLGAIQGCLVVFAVSVDIVPSMGALYAFLGLTSAIAAVVTVSWRTRVRPWNLWILYSTAALLASMMLSTPSGAFGFAVVLALVGLCIGPSLLCLYGLAAYAAPEDMYIGLVSRMTAATSAGMALGLVLSAYFGVRYDYISAALVPVSVALIPLAGSLVFIYIWRRSPLSSPHT